jgi:hypothetical protein
MTIEKILALPQFAEHRRRMSDFARQHQEAMQNTTDEEAADYVQRVVDSSILVFGVYQDAGSLGGIGVHFIKGRHDWAAIIEEGNGRPATKAGATGRYCHFLRRPRARYGSRTTLRRWKDHGALTNAAPARGSPESSAPGCALALPLRQRGAAG